MLLAHVEGKYLQALEDVDEVGGALSTLMTEKRGCRKTTCLLHHLQHRQLLLLLLSCQQLQPKNIQSGIVHTSVPLVL